VPRSAALGGDVGLVDSLGSPALASEYAQLDAFIQAEPCLRAQRGRILARNSCRNPWFGTLNARLTRAFPTAAGQSLELTADVYNLLNLIRRRWGQDRVTTLAPSVPLLKLAGYDALYGRGVYQLALPGRNQIQDFESRWRVELGLRYGF